MKKEKKREEETVRQELPLDESVEELCELDGVEQAETSTDELAVAQDQLLRLAAEYDNFRKRSKREKDALYVDTLCDVVKQWLPLVDNLDRAVQAASVISEQEAQILEGIRLLQRQALEILSKLGVQEIEALGKTFDPEKHHAVLHEEDTSKGEHEIIEVFEKGYARGDTIIRYSVVKVAN